jgi:hypothetical protein
MKTITLRNYDIIDLKEEDGNIFAFKKARNGIHIINKLNVSRDMGNCKFPSIIELSNSAFYIIWLKNETSNIKIFGRRYTPQGLAGKINEFKVTKQPDLKELSIELKDDFFIVLTWTSNDGNIYKKTFNQDAESKSNELFIANSIVDEVKKNFKECDENIKYKVFNPPIPEKVIPKVNDLSLLTPPKVIEKPKHIPLKQTLPPLHSKPSPLAIPKKDIVFKNRRKKLRGTMRMKFN